MFLKFFETLCFVSLFMVCVASILQYSNPNFSVHQQKVISTISGLMALTWLFSFLNIMLCLIWS